jgi:hypothetical protein
MIDEMVHDWDRVGPELTPLRAFSETILQILDNSPDCPFSPPVRLKIASQTIPQFVLYECPHFFRDPLLYLKTLLSLHDHHYPLWQSFARNFTFIDSFFELHRDFITPHSSWECRLCLTELLYQMFSANPKCAPFISTFADRCIDCAISAPLGPSATFLRHAVASLPLLHGVKDQIRPRVQRLIHGLDRADSPLFRMALGFVLRMRPPVFSARRALRIVTGREMRSIADIEIVAALVDNKTVLHALAFLGEAALASKIWHRACMVEIQVILVNWSVRADVRAIFEQFVKRVFVFLALAARQASAAGQAVLICESLSAFLSLRLGWIEPCILSCAASLMATRVFPSFIKCFFPTTALVDDALLRELDMNSQRRLSLGGKCQLFHNLLIGEAPFISGVPTVPMPAVADIGSVPVTSTPIPDRVRTRTDLIKKPLNGKVMRPLASAIFVPSMHRR